MNESERTLLGRILKIIENNPFYDYKNECIKLKDKIDWQNGEYDFSNTGHIRNIMDIQNTSKDIDLFKNYLLHQL